MQETEYFLNSKNYPFIPVEAKLSIIYFWIERNIASGGKIAAVPDVNCKGQFLSP